jgi:TonB family protein
MSQIPERESPNSRFLAGQLPSSGGGFQQLRASALGSIITHGLFVLLAVFVVTRAPDVLAPTPSEPLPDITWIASKEPGGGGGGGGNKMPEPPKKAELKGAEKISVPVAPTPKPVAKETPPPPQVTLPAVPVASSVQELAGLLNTNVSVSVPSQGTGTGGGAGTGSGTGIGVGRGSGVGDGSGGGTGGGEFRAGAPGLINPEPIFEQKPEYTSAAMRAKVQGIVEVEAIVNPDGSVGRVQIVRSLDDRFGLDEEALKAVRKWRFRPGMKSGKAVPVLVVVELQFTLR